MKKRLIEKITKATRNFNTFKGFLAGQNDRVASKDYSRELAGSWSDIKRYLGIAKVSFEFECYLDCADGPFDEDSRNGLDLISLREIRTSIDNLQTYFPQVENSDAYERLNENYFEKIDELTRELYNERLEKAKADFENEQEEMDGEDREEFDEDEYYEENYYDIQEEIMDEYTINDLLRDNYRNLLYIVQSFNFDTPIYGFYSEDDYYIHRTEESQYIDDNGGSDQSAGEYRNDAYNNIKQRLLEVFGDDTKVYVSSEWHGYSTDFKIKNPDAWFVEYDGSLDKYEDSYDKVPVEVITPHIPIGEAIKVLDTFKRKVFEYYHGETDTKRIGCHTNIIFPKDMTLNKAKLIVLSDSDFWAKKFKRFDSQYAYSQIESIKRNILRSNPNSINSTNIEDMEAMISDNINMDKMMSINFLKTNVIEFRFPGNEYFTEYYEDLKEVTQWLVYMVTAALIPSFHRQEYIDKLYRFVSNSAPKASELLLTDLETAIRLYLKFLYLPNTFNSFDILYLARKIFKKIKDNNYRLPMEYIKNLDSSYKESFLTLNKQSNIKASDVVIKIFKDDVNADDNSINLFLSKINSIRLKTPMSSDDKLSYDNDRNATMMFNALNSLLLLGKILQMPFVE